MIGLLSVTSATQGPLELGQKCSAWLNRTKAIVGVYATIAHSIVRYFQGLFKLLLSVLQGIE